MTRKHPRRGSASFSAWRSPRASSQRAWRPPDGTGCSQMDGDGAKTASKAQPNPHGLPKIIDFIFGRFESSWFQVGRKERVARGETPHSGGFQPYSRVLPRLLRGARGRIARVIAGGACPGRPGGRVGRGKSRTLSWAVTQRKNNLPDLFRPDEGDTFDLSAGQKRSGKI